MIASFAIRNAALGIRHSLLAALRGIDADFGLPAAAGSSNQSDDCPARSAMKTPKANPQSLPTQRDIRQILIEADFVDCMVAPCFSQENKMKPRRNSLKV